MRSEAVSASAATVSRTAPRTPDVCPPEGACAARVAASQTRADSPIASARRAAARLSGEEKKRQAAEPDPDRDQGAPSAGSKPQRVRSDARQHRESEAGPGQRLGRIPNTVEREAGTGARDPEAPTCLRGCRPPRSHQAGERDGAVLFPRRRRRPRRASADPRRETRGTPLRSLPERDRARRRERSQPSEPRSRSEVGSGTLRCERRTSSPIGTRATPARASPSPAAPARRRSRVRRGGSSHPEICGRGDQAKSAATQRLAAEISGLPVSPCRPIATASATRDALDRSPDRAYTATHGRYAQAPKWFQYAESEVANPQAPYATAPRRDPASETASSLTNRQAPQMPMAKWRSRKSPEASAAEGSRKRRVGG